MPEHDELLLPVETWSYIAGYLPASEQLKLLHVSRLFHDIALRFVFSTVRIHLAGSDWEMTDADDIQRLMHRSWDILQRIIWDPGFAKVVKTLSVTAFIQGQCIFEQSQSPNSV